MAPRTSSPRVALAAVAASLVVAGCATEAEAPPAASYLALGDSYTIGESVAAGEAFDSRPDPALHVLAHVFKIIVDPYMGKVGVFRVHQGTVRKDSQLFVGDAYVYNAFKS